ncbi:MAG: ribonuclease HII [Oscillospiraceae bacterium]|nr:ribonuclease HII [Oscillospiraceae bacterium]
MELYEFDNEIRQDFSYFCGVDEAGRGPLAGDVYAAAVVFDEGVVIEGINDSKKLSEKKRELLFDEIIEKARDYCIATASIDEIEQINILNAAMLAMKRAIEGLKELPQLALIDGNKSPLVACETKTVVKGDATSQSIAAASILAKVARDRYMKQIDKELPEYQFSKHKGYGTKLHYEMIEKYGISKYHRPSFLKKVLNK